MSETMGTPLESQQNLLRGTNTEVVHEAKFTPFKEHCKELGIFILLSVNFLALLTFLIYTLCVTESVHDLHTNWIYNVVNFLFVGTSLAYLSAVKKGKAPKSIFIFGSIAGIWMFDAAFALGISIQQIVTFFVEGYYVYIGDQSSVDMLLNIALHLGIFFESFLLFLGFRGLAIKAEKAKPPERDQLNRNMHFSAASLAINMCD